MGSYTANYQLYIASAAEQGWGDLVAENFETIDSILKTVSNTATSAQTTAEDAGSKAETAAKTAEWSQISGKPTLMGLTKKSINASSYSFSASDSQKSQSIPATGLTLSQQSITLAVYRGSGNINSTGGFTLTAVGNHGTYSTSVSIYWFDGNWEPKSGSITIPAYEFIKSITISSTGVYRQAVLSGNITTYLPYAL